MGEHLQVITWARWRVQDTFAPSYSTIFTASILKPSWEYPLACASMSIHKGRDKVFMRMAYQDLANVFIIPDEYKERLESGYQEANKQAEHIMKQQKAFHLMNNLAPGASVVRTDTGEILAQAERIIKGEAND